MTALTYAGSVLLALCGLPQAFRAKRDPSSTRGLSWLFLVAWGLGELALLVGLWGSVPWPVLVNYAGNAALVAYVASVKRGLL